eukprot:SAG22_NODE_17808_length_298_cov_0.763819_1_plen_60_part_10
MRDGGSPREFLAELGEGDLLIMGGRCQETHKHELLRLSSEERAHTGVSLASLEGAAYAYL